MIPKWLMWLIEASGVRLGLDQVRKLYESAPQSVRDNPQAASWGISSICKFFCIPETYNAELHQLVEDIDGMTAVKQRSISEMHEETSARVEALQRSIESAKAYDGEYEAARSAEIKELEQEKAAAVAAVEFMNA